METGKEPSLDDTDSAPLDLDVAEESINMADPHADFTLMPPADLSEEASSTDAMFSAPDDLTADWAQWMRWDDVEDTKPSLFNIPNISGSTLPQPGFSFPSDDAVLGTSNCSLPSGPKQLPPSTIFQEQPTVQTIQPAPQSDASSPLAPSPTSSVGRKRKSSHDDSPINDMSASTTDKSAPSKKRSHNIIEKRYRANLNDKIAELRDSVPSLRLTYKQRHGGKKSNEDEDVDITSGNKLNKASILSKATEYIKHLELRNSRLEEENLALKNRFRELEKAQGVNLASYPAVAGSDTSPGACTVSTDSVVTSSPDIFSHASDFSPDSPPNPLFPPEGLLRPPDGFNQLRPTGPQPHYADSFQYNQSRDYDCSPLESTSTTNSSNSPTTRGRRQFMGLPNKFMLGTLAGIMVIGGFENHRSSDPEEKKELFALPLQFLGSFYRLALRNFYFIKANSWQIRALSHFALTSLVIFGCAFFVFLYLFNSRPRISRVPLKAPKTRSISQQQLQQTCVGGSPTEFRQDAWLTSIQTVGVPRHNFFPEWFAVTSRCLEYCIRCLLGWKLYSFITGINADDEKGRVKAWDIALDAQLTGGDAEVSKSRLVLTIFAAGTLPRSPARMMLKAFHCRVLLWRIGSTGSLTSRISDYIAKMLANYQWELAQSMHRKGPKKGEDPLPSHLAFLLAMDCDEVFTDSIVQRATNMIWNRPTQEATDGEDALLDVVVEDTAVRSPLDVLAAWWSSRALQEALLKSLDLVSVESPLEKRKSFERSLDIALHSAPVPSTAYTRATVVKALFFEEDRIKNVNTVLATLPARKSHKPSSCGLTNFLDSSIPPSARDEIFIGVRCAMIAAILRGQVGRGEDEPASSPFSLSSAIKQFNAAPVDEVELTLLGFASHYHLLHITATDERLLPCPSLASSAYSSLTDQSDCSETTTSHYYDDQDVPIPDLARIAADLIFWVRNAYNPISSGLNAKLMEKVVVDCVEVCRNAGIDIDIRKIQRIKTHQRESSVDLTHIPTSSSDGECADAGANSYGVQGRRESTYSNDTGYGSLDYEESKPGAVTQTSCV
ncbi:Clr6 histone deacetylase associated PHD protein-2 Cph2 [Microsporum canis]